ncbi:MAG TPA: excisionase family DNA-binding protein [Patescibacteria group bacterium]|nr:excisionase family DNA-binding protein [Patescibacteria group bacterium]
MKTAKKQYYSVKELADLLQISRIAVFKKIKKGQLKAEKVGRNYIINAGEVKELATTELTEKLKKRIESGVVEVIRQYGDVLKKLGKE